MLDSRRHSRCLGMMLPSTRPQPSLTGTLIQLNFGVCIVTSQLADWLQLILETPDLCGTRCRRCREPVLIERISSDVTMKNLYPSLVFYESLELLIFLPLPDQVKEEAEYQQWRAALEVYLELGWDFFD